MVESVGAQPLQPNGDFRNGRRPFVPALYLVDVGFGLTSVQHEANATSVSLTKAYVILGSIGTIGARLALFIIHDCRPTGMSYNFSNIAESPSRLVVNGEIQYQRPVRSRSCQRGFMGIFKQNEVFKHQIIQEEKN
jgi:hypothetical protein